MPEERDLLARRLSREDLLKLAAVTGGAGLVAGRAGLARAASAHLAKETGRLQVLDWAGYGNDGGQAMFAQYVKTHPNNKPQVHLHGQRGGRAREDPRRPQAGSLPPLRRLGQVLRDQRPRPAVGHEADLELQAPEPVHGQGRPVQRQAVRDPGRLGLRRDPLPQRQGEAEGQVLEPPVRRALQGQDRLVRRHRRCSRSPASTSGSRTRGTRRTTSSSGHRSSSSPRSTSSGRSGRPRPTCGSSSGPATSGSPTPGRTTGCR